MKTFITTKWMLALFIITGLISCEENTNKRYVVVGHYENISILLDTKTNNVFSIEAIEGRAVEIHYTTLPK